MFGLALRLGTKNDGNDSGRLVFGAAQPFQMVRPAQTAISVQFAHTSDQARAAQVVFER